VGINVLPTYQDMLRTNDGHSYPRLANLPSIAPSHKLRQGLSSFPQSSASSLTSPPRTPS